MACCYNSFHVGKGENENYAKVAKLFQKRAREAKDKRVEQ